MKLSVGIIDYGTSNTYSVLQACHHLGHAAKLEPDPEKLKQYDAVILPGVGAFHNGMTQLASRNYIPAVMEYAASGKPFLGICLGMQMLFDDSNEFKNTPGLGMIAGSVRQVPSVGIDGKPHKIPHVGWSALEKPEEGVVPGTKKASGIQEAFTGAHMYFVHSYTALPKQPEHRLLDAYYRGQRISAVVCRDNVFGCQFHPEKSAERGLKLLDKILRA